MTTLNSGSSTSRITRSYKCAGLWPFSVSKSHCNASSACERKGTPLPFTLRSRPLKAGEISLRDLDFFLATMVRPNPCRSFYYVSVRSCSATHTRAVMFQQRRQLLFRPVDSHETIPQSVLSGVLPKIPTQMLTRHTNTRLIAVKGIQVFEVGAHNITYFFQRQRRARFARREKKIDFVEDPWPALRRPADHDAVASGGFENSLGVLRRIDVAVCKHGNLDRRFNGGHGFVLGVTLI